MTKLQVGQCIPNYHESPISSNVPSNMDSFAQCYFEHAAYPQGTPVSPGSGRKPSSLRHIRRLGKEEEQWDGALSATPEGICFYKRTEAESTTNDESYFLKIMKLCSLLSPKQRHTRRIRKQTKDRQADRINQTKPIQEKPNKTKQTNLTNQTKEQTKQTNLTKPNHTTKSTNNTKQTTPQGRFGPLAEVNSLASSDALNVGELGRFRRTYGGLAAGGAAGWGF